MTQEEKAKAYDEAIEALRGLLEGIHEDKCDIMEEDIIKIFPELKESESEDDKMRKAIHIYLDWLDGRKDYQPKGDYTIRDMIAWLEKQGEKPTDEEMTEALRIEYEKGKSDVIAEMQKLVWSEEDERKLLEIKCLIGNYRTGNDEYELCSWIDKIKDRVQPKQEWSEEDERIYRSITYSFAHNFPLVIPQQEFVKSLKERYTWKPSDEQNIYKNGVYQETNGVRIWHNGHTFLVPKDWNKGKWPLLNKKGEKNSKQNKEHLMDEIDALLDWDFVAATKHIQDLGTDIPLKDGEYLITAPVWLAMYEHRIALNKALSNIGAMEIDFNEDFWFAQRSGVNRAWFFHGPTRSLLTYGVYHGYQVGAVTL